MKLRADVEIYLALEPIDLRWSFDRLLGCANDRIGRSAKSGALFVFFGKRRDRVKILFHDRGGYCILYKRLDRGTFRMPVVTAPDAASVTIDAAELDLLLEGLALLDARVTKKSSVH